MYLPLWPQLRNWILASKLHCSFGNCLSCNPELAWTITLMVSCQAVVPIGKTHQFWQRKQFESIKTIWRTYVNSGAKSSTNVTKRLLSLWSSCSPRLLFPTWVCFHDTNGKLSVPFVCLFFKLAVVLWIQNCISNTHCSPLKSSPQSMIQLSLAEAFHVISYTFSSCWAQLSCVPYNESPVATYIPLK